MERDKLHSFRGGLGLGAGWGGLQPHQATTHAAAACGCGTRPSAVLKRGLSPGLNPGRLCRAARAATGGTAVGEATAVSYDRRRGLAA